MENREYLDSIIARYSEASRSDERAGDYGRHPEYGELWDGIEAYARRFAAEQLEKFVGVLDRKKEFYEGAHGDHWEGFVSCLDTLREEYREAIAALKETEQPKSRE